MTKTIETMNRVPVETMNRYTNETMVRRCEAAMRNQVGLISPVKCAKSLQASVPGARQETPAVAMRKPA